MRNIKALRERRNEIVSKMENLLSTVDEREVPTFSEEETRSYNALNEELRAISDQIRRLEELDEHRNTVQAGSENEEAGEENSETESESENENEAEQERAFVELIQGRRTLEELRAASNLTLTDNGAIVPKHIAKKITETLINICPIFEKCSKFHFKGKVSFPVVDDSNDDVICAYAEEFTELESHAPTFDSVDLDGYLIGGLAKISLSLINNSDIDVLGYIVNRLAFAKKKILERELLIGTTDKMTGVLSSENIFETASSAAITADDLIDLQGKIIDAYQEKAIWIVNPETKTALRKLKDGNGRYLLNNDITTGYKDILLGHRVEVSDKMPKMGAGAKAVFYGDPSGLYVNVRENNSVNVLREKYITQHVIGVNIWFECDSKIVEKQKLAILKMADAAAPEGPGET